MHVLYYTTRLFRCVKKEKVLVEQILFYDYISNAVELSPRLLCKIFLPSSKQGTNENVAFLQAVKIVVGSDPLSYLAIRLDTIVGEQFIFNFDPPERVLQRACTANLPLLEPKHPNNT